MYNYSNQQMGAASNKSVPANTFSDIYSNKLSSGYQNTQAATQFSCIPSEYGCMPTTNQPGTSTTTAPSQPLPLIQTQPQPQMPQQFTPPAYDVQYLNQFLLTQVGSLVTVEFLIGTNTFIDKSGTLLAVGTNYILINETNSDDIVACDFYNIKFVKLYH